MSNIKIIAHRGYPKMAPENTMSSFELAVGLGAPAIEFDLHQTLDGELVIHHDYSISHPDNGSEDICRTDFKKISKVDAGSWFSKKFKNEKIPTLKEVFETFKDTIEYEIELKGTTTDFINQTLETVEKYGLLKNIEFTSPHTFILSKLKQINPNIKTGVFFKEYPNWMSKEQGEKIILDTLLVLPADVAHLPISIITNTLLNSIKKHNILIHASDCNNKESIEFAITHSFDQFSTNELELALNMVKT